MKSDLTSRTDVEHLVDAFYAKAIPDPLIGYFFTEVAPLDLEHHLPKLYDFWTSVIFQEAHYRGNPMAVHMQLDDKERIEPQHFQRWLELWKATVDELFTGPRAEEAKARAAQIALLMQMKVRSRREE